MPACGAVGPVDEPGIIAAGAGPECGPVDTEYGPVGPVDEPGSGCETAPGAVAGPDGTVGAVPIGCGTPDSVDDFERGSAGGIVDGFERSPGVAYGPCSPDCGAGGIVDGFERSPGPCSPDWGADAYGPDCEAGGA